MELTIQNTQKVIDKIRDSGSDVLGTYFCYTEEGIEEPLGMLESTGLLHPLIIQKQKKNIF